MPSTAAPLSAAAETEDVLLPALQEAYRATAMHVIPPAQARGLAGNSFWSLYWLTRGTPAHPTELAHRLGITAPACTAIVDQLVGAGLLQRRPSEEDRRQVVLAVTPKGRRTVDAVWDRVADRIRAAIEDIPPDELATTARVLTTMAARLSAEGEHR